jgi:heterodisulfide reductase subunit D
MSRFRILDSTGHANDPYICASCGNCTMVCPTFRQLRWESYGPRGRLQVTKNIMEDKASFDEEYVRKLFMCSLCEYCSQVCTTSLSLDRFWELTRAEAWDAGLVPATVRFACNSVLSNGDPLSMGASSRMQWADDLEIDISDRIEAPAKTAYFLGCEVALKPQLGGIARSMIRILESAGVDYTLLGKKESCCGAPLLWGGDRKNTPLMAEKNISFMEELGVDTIIFSCPSCINTWVTSYSGVIGEPINRKFRMFTPSQYFSELIEKKLLRFEEQPLVTVTYHDPCVASRRLNIIDEPRKLIERIPGVYKVEMAHSGKETMCCGSHGLLNVTDPLLSSQIADMRLREASVTPASRLITECPRCLQALELATHTLQYPILVQDITELVADCLDYEKEDANK